MGPFQNSSGPNFAPICEIKNLYVILKESADTVYLASFDYKMIVAIQVAFICKQ